MIEAKPQEPQVVSHGDYDVITPDVSKLRKAVRPAEPGEADQVALAENALTRIASDFSHWMREECGRLDAARRRISEHGLTTDIRDELFLAAHDVKGYSETLGYPEARRVADSLCRLLEYAPELSRIPMLLVDQHVDAVCAIVREHEREDITTAATELTGKLRQVTNAFLVKENQHRPDILAKIDSVSRAGLDLF
jgi:chemotaxis protein histidine kinase CheA